MRQIQQIYSIISSRLVHDPCDKNSTAADYHAPRPQHPSIVIPVGGRWAIYRAPSPQQDDVRIVSMAVGTFLPHLPHTGITVGGVADGEHGRRSVAYREHDRGVIFVISNVRGLDLLIPSKRGQILRDAKGMQFSHKTIKRYAKFRDGRVTVELVRFRVCLVCS